MGKKLNALLGRNPKSSKLRMLTKLAISRITILKNNHSVRCSQAQSDVVQLLLLGYHERALLRVEQVIKEQNTLDAFVLIENYCHLLQERNEMVKNSRKCPDELKEAISSLIFAASRCGEFPELHEIRGIFTSKFGKEFAAQAVELRNECGVYPKMIQRLSSQQASLESKHKLIKQIAKENGIILPLDNEDFDIPSKILPEERTIKSETPPELVKMKKVYKDAGAAAEDAFESATYAAEAAKAAIKLSRLESWDNDPDKNHDVCRT